VNGAHVLRQLDNIGPVMASNLAQGGIVEFKDLTASDPRRVEQVRTQQLWS